MKVYGAIDLHSNNSVVGLLDEDGRMVLEKRLPNKLALILEQFLPYQPAFKGS